MSPRARFYTPAQCANRAICDPLDLRTRTKHGQPALHLEIWQADDRTATLWGPGRRTAWRSGDRCSKSRGRFGLWKRPTVEFEFHFSLLNLATPAPLEPVFEQGHVLASSLAWFSPEYPAETRRD
jgi:hypothetical protein